MNEKLSLDSLRWGSLQSFGEDAQRLPTLIRQSQAAGDPAKSEAFAELLDQIYQEYSCSEAAYATVPYLVQIGARLVDDKSGDLWIWVGHIAGTCNAVMDHAPEDLLPACKSALHAAEPHCIETLLVHPWGLMKSYYLSVAAIALAGHPLGKLVMDNLFAHKNADAAAICPRCGEQVVVAFFNSGLVVRDKAKLRPDPPESGQLPDRPGAFEIPKRLPNPWTPVGQALRALIEKGGLLPGALLHLEAAAALADGGLTPDVQPGPVFSLLGGLITLKGYPEPAMRYFHAWDRISCPSCKSMFVFADHWWGLKR